MKNDKMSLMLTKVKLTVYGGKIPMDNRRIVKKTMDGNEAAAYASFAFTEVAAIYPITPSSPMAEHIDKWAAQGKENIFGEPVKLVEMQSEAGAIGALHGSVLAGALSTTYTSSQGLLLMIPTMYRIAGQLKTGVIHVASRSVAPHAYSIFAEHSDVMACRQTGFAMLSSSSVQEAMDIGAVAHLASIKSHVPFMHFFDGFRTSHEIQKIDCLDYDELAKLVDKKALREFRRGASSPENPTIHTTGQCPEVYFQCREAVNPYYDRLPEVVEECLGQISRLTGRDYRLFNYYGAPDAENVIVAMGSVCGTIQETVDYLNAEGGKTGVLTVHLYRPFSAEHFLRELPDTVKRVAVLDRTKEPGSVGEPLYEDICSVFSERDDAPVIVGGIYGIGGKNTTPTHISAVFDNLSRETPRNHFTLGITDNVTFRSLPVGDKLDVAPAGMKSLKFWGIGSDGTVSANKNTIKIIGDHTDMYVQAYFEYDGKKSGGVTKSHLRFGKSPIKSAYYVDKADFVACHNQASVTLYDVWSDLKSGGVFLLNTSWRGEELDKHLPDDCKAYIANNGIRFYTIDANGIARSMGMSKGVNTILQAAFFKATEILPVDRAAEYMRQYISKTYANKGETVIKKNHEAIEKGLTQLRLVEVPETWKDCAVSEPQVDSALPEFVSKLMKPVLAQKGESLPVSSFVPYPGGVFPTGTSKYEKRGISEFAPAWDPAKCIQCNLCSYVCPHAALRPFLLNEEEAAAAPAEFKTVPAKGKGLAGCAFSIQISALDCAGCGSCVNVCPAKEKALSMECVEKHPESMPNWYHAMTLPERPSPIGTATVKGSQFQRPLLEFPGACPGCGESPYVKLVTQLYGDRMYAAIATGCSQVWQSEFPSFPYCSNSKGRGPATANSLFENNGEFGFGIALASDKLREALRGKVQMLADSDNDESVRMAARRWLDAYDDGDASVTTGDALRELLENSGETDLRADVLDNAMYLTKKSTWIIGGDGWAYDIGYGGLDHILSMGEDVNVLVLDTEVYSNTGGQASKATPKGAMAQFAASGRKSEKKDLGRMIMTYGNVYVAQVAMGADPAQLLKAIREAESFKGPSVIIAYAPCINHGLRRGMDKVQTEMKMAVDCGYWTLYRFDPRRKAEGKNPLILDSGEPKGDLREFLMGENRFASLAASMPEESARLLAQAAQELDARYSTYKSLSE